MDFMGYILDKAIILWPALWIIGIFIKKIPSIPDWTIPFILLVLGLGGAFGIMGLTVEAAIQGVLVTGAAVLVDQGIKQVNKATSGDG